MNDLIREVKADMEMINEKQRTIKGYGIVKKLLEATPQNFIDEVSIEDDVLWFGGNRLGKINNIDSISSDITEKLAIKIDVERIKGEGIIITFPWSRKTKECNNNYKSYEVIKLA